MERVSQRYEDAVPVDKLRPHPLNANLGASAVIAESIGENGWYGAVVAHEGTGYILAGNHRWEEAQKAGADTVPVIWLEVDEKRASKILAVDNESSRKGRNDDAKLAALLESLDGDLLGTGYGMEELDALLKTLSAAGRTNGLTDEDATPEPPDAPLTVLGDVWLLGDHRLMCGDCTDSAHVSALMIGERAGLMATDPPYLVDYDAQNHPPSAANRGSANRNKEWADYQESEISDDLYDEFLGVALECALDKRALVYQWHAGTRADLLLSAWKKHGVLCHQQVIWAKERQVLTYADFMQSHEPCFYGWVRGMRPDVARRPPVNEPTVWRVDQKGESAGIHPTQKPVVLISRPMEWHLEAGGLAYEPFAGSGTALIAAEKTGRRCFAMEKAPAFVDVGCRRFQEFTGTLPVLERTGEAHDFVKG